MAALNSAKQCRAAIIRDEVWVSIPFSVIVVDVVVATIAVRLVVVAVVLDLVVAFVVVEAVVAIVLVVVVMVVVVACGGSDGGDSCSGRFDYCGDICRSDRR